MAFLLVPAFFSPVMRLFSEPCFMVVNSFLGSTMAGFLMVSGTLSVRMVHLHPIASLGWAKAHYEE
jgi:hypothetical protein